MQLFHFLSSKYALDALANQKIKVSLFDSLNDPFELLAAGTGESEARSILTNTKSRMAEELRLLCCSKTWNEPLLWSHYADKHKGIALVLEVPDEVVIHVEYTHERKLLDLKALLNADDADAVLPISNMLLNTKYEGWRYEDEARLLFNTRQTVAIGDHEFVCCDDLLKITGLILGPLCEIDEREIQNKNKSNIEIKTTFSRLADNSFEVIGE